MEGPIVGRDAVLDRAWQALAMPGTVLVDGPAGIGKTALWRALVGRATKNGWLVLPCAPAEAEASLSLAALADLLRPLATAVPDLPGPQRAAVEVVLTADSGPVEELALGAATRALLDTAAGGPSGSDSGSAARRVLVAVDDPQWLDPPSERALRYALRRVARIAVLVASRTSETGGPATPLQLDQGPTGGRLTRMTLAPLGVGALHHVLRDRVGATLSRPLLARIARDAGGNPLLAIELARAVLRLPRLPLPGEDLPVATSMQELLVDALGTLPRRGRDAVRMAALLTVPALRELAAAGVSPADFDAAEEAGLLAVTPAAVEFAHPVYAAAVRAAIPPGVRRRLHGTLAGVVTDRDERARHLARCTVGPDHAIARELADAAGRQRARGAPELAAELLDRAAELTPDGADRDRRRLEAVRCRFDSGDYATAGAAADTAAVELTGDARAEALLLRSVVAFGADGLGDAVATAERALLAATPGTPLAGRIHAHLSLFQSTPEPAIRHAEAACELLSGSSHADDDRAVLSAALLLLMHNEVRAGRPARTELLERALELEGAVPSWLAGTVPAIWWKSTDQHGLARTRLLRMLDTAVARGDEPSQHELLTHLGEAELLAGRWPVAAEHITAARELGEQLGTGLVGESWLAGLLDAHRGRLAEAGAAAAQGLRRAAEQDDDWMRRINQQLAGFVALSAGRWADAAAAYGALATIVDSMGLVEPMSLRYEPDWIEACLGAGDLDTAHAALDRLAERHRRLPRPWTTLGQARSRVLMAGADGASATDALVELTAARDGVPPDVVPLDRARCLLVAGMAHRRARRKREARVALDGALAEFTALGAGTFADRTRQELARIGGRPPAPRGLTATEERVALLAARGRTNRLIADELFVSPKTVEANLARVYAKLGISSRAELGAAMRPDAQGNT